MRSIMYKYVLNNISLPIGQSEDTLIEIAKKQLGGEPGYFRLLKKSLDARNKHDIRWIYSFEFADRYEPDIKQREEISQNKIPLNPIVIVGSGPAGLFCAIRLIEYGIKPIIIERGDPIERRAQKIDVFARKGVLDSDSNIQFGEGGAGTFSDGKLNTQTHSGYNSEVLETFVRFGAPKEILYLSKPHIGSDNLHNVVLNMRNYILNNGGQIRFRETLKKINVIRGRINSIVVSASSGDYILQPHSVILAIGHSARDTFQMLFDNGVGIVQKDFAVGVRIEHLQEQIGRAQYGNEFARLPAADYKLVSHAGSRAAFTFCMCPGGYVMPAASEENGVVTNGMSNYARNAVNANSALIVPVSKSDFKSDSCLAGIEFQRRIENNAFIFGGSSYAAPVQLVGDFLAYKKSKRFADVIPSYPHVNFAEMDEILPRSITDVMRIAIKDMGKKLRGFDSPSAVLTAVESRTSSPVRIERNADMRSVNVSNLYPCGEGAGYAGGITSSAADGLRIADAIAMSLK